VGNFATSPALVWAIFLVVYAGLAIGKLPFVHLDRAGIALVGATAMLVSDRISFEDAVASIDYHTLALLFGMMVVVAYLRLGGFFRGLSAWFLNRAKDPIRILALLIAVSGVLSAFLVNDVVCIALGPVVLRLAQRVRRSPLPYLVALATSANVGSVGTITGNPQNMIIGTLSKISYASFGARLGPVAAIGLVLNFAVVALVFRRTLAEPLPDEGRTSVAPKDPLGEPTRELLPKGVTVLVLAVALFFTGVPVSVVALGAAAVLMIGRVRPERIYSQIDWNLLVMFTGLFVVVHAFEHHIVSTWNLQRLTAMPTAPIATLTGLSAVLSNLVSNVPAVLLLKSAITSLTPSAQGSGWLTLAMATTLAGNLSPIASVANLIVVEGARREGIDISFWDYCKVGIPVTIVTLITGALWLSWIH
jgi:Na+/H+ antiporter NhaD/arsenite permease-like protein